MRRATAALLGSVAFCATSLAHAKPQWNAGLELGACSDSSSFGLHQVGFCSALHADVLWREAERGFALGSALRLGTARFSDVRLDPGFALLVPLFESFPLVLEAGPHLLDFHQPGIWGSAFFGIRSFNHSGHYEMTGGLQLSAEHAFGDGTPTSLWLTARVDGAWLVMPVMLIANALR